MGSTGQASSFSPDHATPSRTPQDGAGGVVGTKSQALDRATRGAPGCQRPPGARALWSCPVVRVQGIDPLVMEMRKPVFICDTLAQLVNTRNGERCSKNTI